MTSATVLFVIAAFLSGTVTAVFAVLVAGIHAGDRPRHLTAASHGQLEALTRTGCIFLRGVLFQDISVMW